VDIDDRELDREGKLCRSDKRDIYLGNEMTKSEQQTFRIACICMKTGRRRAFMPVRVPLIVKNSREKVEVVRRYTRAGIKRISRFAVADSIFTFFLLYPTAAIVPRFQNSKKSFVYSCRYRAGFFPAAVMKKEH